MDHRPRLYLRHYGMHQVPPGHIHIVQPGNGANGRRRDPQFFPGLTKGTFRRALAGLHVSAREADLPGLPLQGVGPDLKEDLDLSPPLHQGDQHGIVGLGPHDLRDMPHEFLFKL